MRTPPHPHCPTQDTLLYTHHRCTGDTHSGTHTTDTRATLKYIHTHSNTRTHSRVPILHPYKRDTHFCTHYTKKHLETHTAPHKRHTQTHRPLTQTHTDPYTHDTQTSYTRTQRDSTIEVEKVQETVSLLKRVFTQVLYRHTVKRTKPLVVTDVSLCRDEDGDVSAVLGQTGRRGVCVGACVGGPPYTTRGVTGVLDGEWSLSIGVLSRSRCRPCRGRKEVARVNKKLVGIGPSLGSRVPFRDTLSFCLPSGGGTRDLLVSRDCGPRP